MKYIIVEKAGLELAILFPEQIQHNEALNVLAQPVCPVKPIAAGFCHLQDDGFVTVKGESVSLKLKSRGLADAEAIQCSLNFPSIAFV